jgi:hypothetical protein
MSRWFRHYAGMVRDDKLVRAAIHAKQPVERVVWVFGAILESAAEVNDGGTYEFDAGEAAHFLHCEETDINSITEALTSLSRLGDGRVTRWPGRQFQSDMSALRQKRYRARKNAEKSNGNNMDSAPSHTVTRPSRDGAVTDQRQSTETEKKERKIPTPKQASGRSLEFSKYGSPEDHFWELATALEKDGVVRSRSAQLLKLSDGTAEAALVLLRQVADAQAPSAYLGKLVANLKIEQAPLSFTVGGDAKEPEFVQEFRRAGYPIETRDNGTWRIGGDLFDARGQVIGG